MSCVRQREESGYAAQAAKSLMSDMYGYDWDSDERTTRSIHVDVRYMLWVMEHIDGAQPGKGRSLPS